MPFSNVVQPIRQVHGADFGSPSTFALAVGVVIVWAATGPLFQFSDTWQLVINTGTTIVTFLMVFLIQNTQNRDSAAMHVKLDELLRAVQGAHTAMADLRISRRRSSTPSRPATSALANEAKARTCCAAASRIPERPRWGDD